MSIRSVSMCTNWLPGVSAAILLIYCSLVGGQTICPVGPTNCTAMVSGSTIIDMTCSNLGNLLRVPPACTDPRSIKQFTVTPGTTTIANIQNSSFDGLQIESLTLSNLGISNLDSQAFSGLENYLQTLMLDNNILTTIPVGMFSKFAKLTYLYLDSNKLVSLEIGFFDGLTNLASLLLQSNQIASVADRTFSSLGKLNDLQIQDNQIKTITNLLFTGLSGLTKLRLDENQVSRLSTDTFTNLPKLQILNLSSNAISYLPPSLFVANADLEILDLSANVISNCDANTFNSTKKLRELYLNDNSISSIPDFFFVSMNSLEILRMQHNTISVVSSNSLSGLPYVTDVSLNHNRIKVLPDAIFDSLGSLTTFDLSNNQIGTVGKDPFSSQRNLVTLDLSNNTLTEIRGDFFHKTSNLQNLYLKQNQISTITIYNSTSYSGSHINTIDLSGNQLNGSSLTGKFLFLTSLVTLRLDNNPLKEIDTTAMGLSQSVVKLFLNDSCLESISVHNLPSLSELYLQQNLLKRLLSTNLSATPGLRILDLGYNDLTYIAQDALSLISQLSILNLTQNSLNDTQVFDLFTDISQGTNLSASVIPSLSQATVDLTWNKITELHSFPPLTQFYLSGNPLKCDCAALPSLSSISQFVDFKTTICTSSPANNPSFLLCHLANQTECFQQTIITDLNSTRDFCTANIPDQSMQVPRYSTRKSCKVPTPRILELYLTPTDTGFETWWKMETVGGISGFQLTWETDGWKNTTYMPIDGNQTGSNINTTLHSPGNYVVCLRVVMIDQSLLGDYRCQNVTVFLNSSGCRTGGTQCPTDAKSTQESGLFPLLLYIIIPVAGFLVIVVIIVVVCVCVRRRKQEKDAKKGQGVHRTLSGTSDGEKESGFQAGLAEQATVSMDMFTECPY